MAQRPPAKHPAGVLPRVIFGVALFGVLVVTHLWLQKQAGFAYGCAGVEDLSVTNLAETMREEPGCAEVTNSVYATFLGVSNIVWGLLFYLAVAALRLAYAATGNDRLRLASFALGGVGLLYTLYLVYLQAAVIQAFCVLCMTSAATVTLLLILHVMEHRRLRQPAAAPARNAALALKPFALVTAVFAVLLVADVVVAQQRDGEETAEDGGESTGFPDTPPAPETPDVTISDPATQCTYDPQFEPIAEADYARFIDGVYQGGADAPVRVIEFYDPNCPHCKELGETLQGVIARNGEKARFYFQPFPLRDNSFGQVAALYLAEEQGRYFELMEEFFDRQDQMWGMTLDEVVASAEEVGMNGEALRVRLDNQAQMQPVLADIVADRVAAVAMIGIDEGVSVPKLLVDGRVVASTYESYSADCLDYFIDQAYQARTGGGAEAGAAQ